MGFHGTCGKKMLGNPWGCVAAKVLSKKLAVRKNIAESVYCKK